MKNPGTFKRGIRKSSEYLHSLCLQCLRNSEAYEILSIKFKAYSGPYRDIYREGFCENN